METLHLHLPGNKSTSEGMFVAGTIHGASEVDSKHLAASGSVAPSSTPAVSVTRSGWIFFQSGHQNKAELYIYIKYHTR